MNSLVWRLPFDWTVKVRFLVSLHDITETLGDLTIYLDYLISLVGSLGI